MSHSYDVNKPLALYIPVSKGSNSMKIDQKLREISLKIKWHLFPDTVYTCSRKSYKKLGKNVRSLFNPSVVSALHRYLTEENGERCGVGLIGDWRTDKKALMVFRIVPRI